MPAHRSDPTSSVIELNDVVFCWPGASSPTLDIAHLQIARGEHLFVKGPSAAASPRYLAF